MLGSLANVQCCMLFVNPNNKIFIVSYIDNYRRERESPRNKRGNYRIEDYRRVFKIQIVSATRGAVM